MVRFRVPNHASLLIIVTAGVPLTGLFKSPLLCFTTLRYINLELHVRCGSPAQSLLPFRGLFDELRRFPSSNVLEDVDIILRVTDRETWTVNVDEWLLLATVFSKESFPRLKTVNARTSIAQGEDWTAHDVAAEIKRLPFGSLELHYDFLFTLNYDGDLVHIECKKSE